MAGSYPNKIQDLFFYFIFMGVMGTRYTTSLIYCKQKEAELTTLTKIFPMH